jgi:hypothetical protein
VYIGHVGAALAAKRARRSIGLLALLLATYAPDWVDTGLCLAGTYNPDGLFSHSIPVIALLSVIGFLAYGLAARDWTSAGVVAALVVSHMFLDWITGYKPTWPGGTMIGLRLYDHPVADFGIEGIVIAIGVALYAKTLPVRRRAWIDVSIMLGALLALQLAIDAAHLLVKTLPKC